MNLSIDQLERESPLDAAAVDGFLASHTFPIVEGTSVTFVYRGEAEAVHLQHWIYGLPTSQPFKRLHDQRYPIRLPLFFQWLGSRHQLEQHRHCRSVPMLRQGFRGT